MSSETNKIISPPLHYNYYYITLHYNNGKFILAHLYASGVEIYRIIIICLFSIFRPTIWSKFSTSGAIVRPSEGSKLFEMSGTSGGRRGCPFRDDRGEFSSTLTFLSLGHRAILIDYQFCMILARLIPFEPFDRHKKHSSTTRKTRGHSGHLLQGRKRRL